MKNSHTLIYPSINAEQRKLSQAFHSMHSVMEYLKREGFEGLNGKYSDGINEHDYNTIGGKFGKIVFPNGSEVNKFALRDHKNNGDLIRRIGSGEDVKYIPNGEPSLNCCVSYEDMNLAMRLSLGNDDYQFMLSVVSTTNETLGPIVNSLLKRSNQFGIPWHWINPKSTKFANEIYSSLTKESITDEDLQEFKTYQEGIQRVVRNEGVSQSSYQSQ